MRIGVIGMGEMGAATGGRLRERGATVVSLLAGRSNATTARAARYGIESVANEEALVDGSAFILSIVPPGIAADVARQFVPALSRATVKPIFLDCNALAPQTVRGIADIIAPSGAPFLDAGIIGSPPTPDGKGARFYVSGANAQAIAALDAFGLNVRILDGPVGNASGLKMSYAGITKGMAGLAAMMYGAAERHGLYEALRAELAASQADILPKLDRQAQGMPPKAYRWVAEMQEIGTFAGDDPTAKAFYDALAAYFDRVAHDRVTA